MDITPLVPEISKVIQGYGNHRFKINGEWLEGHLIVFPTRIVPWQVRTLETATLESLGFEETDATELLLVGTGTKTAPFPAHIRQQLKARGIVVECMDTGAACRTYNVLLSEGRRVAAALMAVE